MDEPAPDCVYCDKGGANCCVRLTAPTSGPSRSVYAHEGCATDRGLTPLYQLIPSTDPRLGHAS